MLRWLQPQYRRERRDAKVAYQEAFRRLEADFYSYVLAKPDVREILEVLQSEAIDLALRTGRDYRLPPTLQLLEDMVHAMRDDMDSESSITWAVTFRLTVRDDNRRKAWSLALWVAVGLLLQLLFTY